MTITFVWYSDLAIVDDEISESHCYLYAVIREKAAGVTLNICATAERRSQLYTTSTNSLEISIITDVAEDVHPQFLIEFQGTVPLNYPPQTYIILPNCGSYIQIADAKLDGQST